MEKREDRLVRRGIDVLSKRHGEERSESESDPGSEASSSREDKGKARSIDLETGEEIPPPAPRHRKETPSKKVRVLH